MPTVQGLYTPPANFVGVSPKGLRYGGVGPDQSFGGLYGQLASALGIGEETPLENKAYAVAIGPGQESEYIQKYFTSTSPTAGFESTLSAGKPLVEAAYSERGRQLETEKAPLTERYNALITELTRRETQDVGQLTTNLAREYGRRGVPLSSSAYSEDLFNKQQPIKQFYSGQGVTVGLEKETKLREINNLLSELPIQKAKELQGIDEKIAELKMSGQNQQLQMALEQYRAERADYWQQQDLDLRKQAFQFEKYQAENPTPSYQAVQGPGASIYSFNPATGQFNIGVKDTIKTTFGGASSGDGRYSLD